MSVIPFYGAEHPDLFAIERAAMDRPGVVIDRLNDLLPPGSVLDIGAGDGFTAERLARPDRNVIAVEPAAGMIDRTRPLDWVRGDAEALPFRDGTIDGILLSGDFFIEPAEALHDLQDALVGVEHTDPAVLAVVKETLNSSDAPGIDATDITSAIMATPQT